MQSKLRDTLTTGAFMAIGLQETINKPIDLLDHWDGGHYELVYELMLYAQYTDALLDAGFALMGTSPGVAAYEVAEEFGTWFGAQIPNCDAGHLPAAEACHAKLRTLVTTFYKPMRTGELSAVLIAVPLPDSGK